MKKQRVLCASAALLCGFWSLAGVAHADPVRVQWPQPGGTGTPISITYSYSNLLDGTLLLMSPSELRAATEEALALWASYAPLHFIERPDSGPPPGDASYPAGDHPQIRIGHQRMADLARGFSPSAADGLGGDIHIDGGVPWTVGEGHWNFLEAIAHELGHTLGLPHELERIAIMNPSYPQHRFGGLGSSFLFPADIEALQEIYGAGRGSVQPLSPVPDPATVVLVATGLLVFGRARLRRSGGGGDARSPR